MRIGQAFFKLNKEDRLSTFTEHKFDVIKVFGVEENKLGNVNLVVSTFKSTYADVSNSGNKKSTSIELNVSIGSFISSSDLEQNNTIQRELGYVSNHNNLVSEHRGFVTQQIEIERNSMASREANLKRIEDSF